MKVNKINNIIKISNWELFRYISSNAFIITLIIPFIIILIAGVPQYLAVNSEQPVMNIGIIDKGNNLFGEIEKQVSNDSERNGKDQFILQHYAGVENNENIFIKELIKSNIADIVVVLETQLIDSGNV